MSTERSQHKRFYGRRSGRPLRSARSDALDSLLPKIGINEDVLNEDAALDPASLFSKTSDKITLEIGFGSGEHLKAQIENNSDTCFLGAEPFINGMSTFLKDIQPSEDAQNRCRVLMDDALLLVNSLKDSSIDTLYILNPDPWHKTRHHKRRIVRPETLDQYARILKPGGALIMSTDVPYLADWMFTHTFNHGAFKWQATRADDWRTAPKGWFTTRYEVKGAKGAKVMSYLLFTRK